MRQDNRPCNAPSRPKDRYRVRNWAQYNAGLIARGDVTLWIEEAALQPAGYVPGRFGRPRIYSDACVQMLLTMKSVFHLPLRALQGFAQSLRQLGQMAFAVPNYSTLSRRAKTLEVTLPVLREPGQGLHILVDSTGVKVFGEGEWKVRQHGWAKRRTWRKLHLCMDAHSGQVCAVVMTHRDVDDGGMVNPLLEQIPDTTPVEAVGADGAYDSRCARRAIAQRGARALIPPVAGAAHWREDTPGAQQRNEAVDAIAQDGKRQWKRDCGYHKRSLVENLMYRFKTLTGDKLWARTVGAQAAEVAVRVGIVNYMLSIARPQSARIG